MPQRISLVVDDDPSIRMFMAAVLQQEQFDTLQAEDGIEALEMLRTIDGSIDLIVSDIQMPRGDGLSFARAVRALFPSIPIILVSGYVRPEDAFEFIEKPFSAAELASTVRKVVCEQAA